jgi:hypothetical protein
VANAAFPDGQLARRMPAEQGPLVTDTALAPCVAAGGRAADGPGRLAWVIMLHEAAGVCERQAAAAVRRRIAGTAAVGRARLDPGVDRTVRREGRPRGGRGQAASPLGEALVGRWRDRPTAAGPSPPADGLDIAVPRH